MTETEKVDRPDSVDTGLLMPGEAGSDATTRSSTPKRVSDRAGTEMMGLIVLALAAAALGVFLVSLTGRFFFHSEQFGDLASLFSRLCFYGEQFGNFRLQIAGLMLPFAIIVFRMGRWRWLAYSLALAIVWSFASLGWVYLPAAQPAAGKQKLKIMSFNVLGHNSMKDEVLEIMHDADPDVIMIIEYTQDWHLRLRSLKKEYPYQVLQPRWHGFGLGLFSKYPLSDTKVLQLTRKLTDNPSVITHVKFGDQTIRVCGVHVLSPTNSFRLDIRNQQYGEVADELAKDDVPTVVMGDFNSVPWSPFVKDFMAQTGCRDSRQGFGYHASWHADYLMLRIPIDHAFVSRDVCVHSRSVGGIAGSDHMPIIFEVSTAQ